MAILPTQTFPALDLPLTNDLRWELGKQDYKNHLLMFFYRGKHCPVCRKQLRELERQIDTFEAIGVNLIAISMNNEALAKATVEEWGIRKLPVAYDLSVQQAHDIGLYLSKGINDSEPEIFSEPGLFIVKPDYSVYASSIQTMPFTRPSAEELIGALKYIQAHDYPPRGEYQP